VTDQCAKSIGSEKDEFIISYLGIFCIIEDLQLRNGSTWRDALRKELTTRKES
jgi:hypothetical protein